MTSLTRLRPILLGLALLAVAAHATPAARAADVGLGLRAGTQGIGVEGAVGLTKWFSLRGGIYDASLSDDTEEGGIVYDGTLEVGGVGLIADVFPTRGSFRLSAGLFSNDNGIELTATPVTPQQIGDSIYTPAQIGTLLGRVEFDDTAPYLGIGWGSLARGKRVGFLFDLGVVLQGSGEVSLVATGGGVDPDDLADEAAEVEAEISDYDLWPVVSFGLAIRL